MNYFVSCIYGDYSKYMKIKNDVLRRPNDKLWIIGDVLDGNEEDPAQNIDILNDIMGSENITLILGDHEYARCMEYSSSKEAEISKSWKEFAEKLDVSGGPLNTYVSENFSTEDRDTYFGSFLVGSCELSTVIPIGKRYFYAVHGKPTTFISSLLSEWQLSTCSGIPDFKKELFRSIKTDEFSIPFVRSKTNPMTKDNTFAILGQMSPSLATEKFGYKDNGSGIFFGNSAIGIGRTYPDEPIPVLGVDAAGFFVKGIY